MLKGPQDNSPDGEQSNAPSHDVEERLMRAVGRMNVSPLRKFAVLRGWARLKEPVRRMVGRRPMDPSTFPLVPYNRSYGHEYWLKRYSGYEGDVLAGIEHGVFFGDAYLYNLRIIQEEWQFGAFITYGRYREEVLRRHYPNHFIAAVGPYISYAETDVSYQESIRDGHPVPGGRTITVFPAHSGGDVKRRFDHEETIAKTARLADEFNCPNRMACLSYHDYSSDLVAAYRAAGFQVVTGGVDEMGFLPRLRAIFGESSITASNDIGTHIGYSLAMGVPHVLFEQERVDLNVKCHDDFNSAAFESQKREMFSAFNAAAGPEISDEQRCLVEFLGKA